MPATRATRAPSAERPKADADSTQARLEKLGIRTNRELVLHLPLRYEDETKLTARADVRPGEPALNEAEVVEVDCVMVLGSREEHLAPAAAAAAFAPVSPGSAK